MTPQEEIHEAVKLIRMARWANLEFKSGDLAFRPEPLAQLLTNLAHTWDQNEWDTNNNALEIAQRIRGTYDHGSPSDRSRS